ncbi:hypothetical protein ACS0TY_016063 [Phlomoides rotata]
MEATAIDVGAETSRERKGKAPLLGNSRGGGAGSYKRGVAIFDLILRVSAAAASLGATIAMGTTEQTLPFFTQPLVAGPRLLLILCDTLTVALANSAASSSAAIVYLAHNGNSDANWLAICQQFTDFCQRISGAVVASFIAVALLLFLLVLSALALWKH